MTDDVRRETPASGTPAILVEASRRSPPGDTASILQAIEKLGDRMDAYERKNEQRLDSLEKNTERRFDGLERELAQHKVEEAEARTRTASAAAKACETSYEALRQASTAKADVQSIVESALRIYGSSIGSIVDGAVKKAIEPVTGKVDELETGQTDCNEALGEIVKELGLQDRVKLGPVVNPDDKPPVRLLPSVNQNTKIAAVGGGLAFGAAAIELAIKILSHF